MYIYDSNKATKKLEEGKLDRLKQLIERKKAFMSGVLDDIDNLIFGDLVKKRVK